MFFFLFLSERPSKASMWRGGHVFPSHHVHIHFVLVRVLGGFVGRFRSAGGILGVYLSFFLIVLTSFNTVMRHLPCIRLGIVARMGRWGSRKRGEGGR